MHEAIMLRLGTAFVVAIQLCLGLYFVYLNRLFYERFGPFYDSASYLNRLVDLQIVGAAGGFPGVLREALSPSTAALPWLLFAPFATWFDPHRAAGVWIQIAASMLMSVALVRYLISRRFPVELAVACATAFSCLAAAFRSNGGMADFRLDLLQYFLYATLMVAYLRARESRSVARWCWCGFAAGLLCLGRASSVVYLALLAPVLLVADLIADKTERRALLARWAAAALVATAAAGWFYAQSWRYLRSYYLEWNVDARARLPLSQSLEHLRFAAGHVGLPLALAAVLLAGSAGVAAWRSRQFVAGSSLSWRPLLFSAVPIGFLVLSGKGLNPFVSIIGASGVLLFLFDPANRRGSAPAGFFVAPRLLAAAVWAAILWSAFAGFSNHTSDSRVASWIPRQPGLGKVVKALVEESRTAGAEKVTFRAVHVGTLNGAVLLGALVYDLHLPPASSRRGVIVDATELTELDLQGFDATEAGWMLLPGASDEERLESVVTSLNAGADLLIVVDSEAVLPPHVYPNRFANEINGRTLAAGDWRSISASIRVSATESVRLYRNLGRARR